MRKFRKYPKYCFLVILLYLLTFKADCLIAQGVCKDCRITYLWDVTLSMSGWSNNVNLPKAHHRSLNYEIPHYDKDYDIYDKVVEAMINDINQIDDQRTEIVVVPFQGGDNLQVMRDYATPEGKINIIRKIQEFRNTNVTNTSISAPLVYSINNVFSKDKIDVLKLMTDGIDNVNPNRFMEVINNWCTMAEDKDVYGYYVLLTDAAVDEELQLVLEKQCRMKINRGTEIDKIISLMPLQKLTYNIRDDYGKSKTISFSVHGTNQKMPEGFRVHVSLQNNPYMYIDEDVTLSSANTIELNPKFIMEKNDAINQLPTTTNEKYLLYIRPSAGMDVSPYSQISVLDNGCYIEIINKPEKTLNFYVEPNK